MHLSSIQTYWCLHCNIKMTAGLWGREGDFDLSLCHCVSRISQKAAKLRRKKIYIYLTGMKLASACIKFMYSLFLHANNQFGISSAKSTRCYCFSHSPIFPIFQGICFCSDTVFFFFFSFDARFKLARFEINKCVWIQSGLKHYNCEHLSLKIHSWIFKRMWALVFI